MTSGSAIPLYREINECHEATGFPIRTDLREFHAFSIADTYPCAREAMPPYRRGFYQLTLLENMAAATMSFEDEALVGMEDVLVFSPPEQVMSWICGGSEQGYIVYFQPEVMAREGRSIEELFPFFGPNAHSVLPLAREELKSLGNQFEQLRAVGLSQHPYRLARLAALTTALLYDCLALYERAGQGVRGSVGSSSLVVRFRQLLAQCFQHHCSVESYAECLNVSADHLRAVVKRETGRTVRELIEERVMLEAKRLLTHTTLNVGEVAWHLQFSEPTHFARFFKRHTGRTPLEFRRTGQIPISSVG